MCSRSWRRSPRSGRESARRGQLLDVVLELVDLLVERVDQVEVVLGDLVDEAVGDHPGAARPAGTPRGPVAGRTDASPGGVLRTVTSTSRVTMTSISW